MKPFFPHFHGIFKKNDIKSAMRLLHMTYTYEPLSTNSGSSLVPKAFPVPLRKYFPDNDILNLLIG